MIDKIKLMVMLASFSPIRDYEKPVRMPIPSNSKIIDVIATAAMETDDPIAFAIYLNVLGAHETAFNVALVGDHVGGVARSCGAWQTPCDRTPGFAKCTDEEAADPQKCRFGWTFHAAPTIALQQARLACRIIKVARDNCPSHPIWQYASGQCMRTRTASLYEEDVDEEIAASTPLRNPL